MKNDYTIDPTLTTDTLKRRDRNKTMYIFSVYEGKYIQNQDLVNINIYKYNNYECQYF